MTDGVTDNIVWILVTRMSSSIPGWVLKKKRIDNIYVLYILYVIYIVYILYAYYIYRVKSEWYINRTSVTKYIG